MPVSFDQDIVIERVADPFTIYGDPESTAVDSSDWNVAFATEQMTKATFQSRWKGADAVNWDDYRGCSAPWVDGDHVTVAEYWTRERGTRTILMLSTGEVVDEKVYLEQKPLYDAKGATVVGSRETGTHKVKMHLLTGAEVLETREWGGRYIPIIPVYGEEYFLNGRRHLQGIVRSAIPAQQNFNLWRSASTESVLTAPIAPWVGPKGAFNSDAAKWATANRLPHAFLEYDVVGANGETIPPPQRTVPNQIPAASIQEALNASDDIKAITGIHDASLGARSNETSGKAIMARQREGDISTFHYIDNQSRAIQHTGRVILDLIPTVYSAPRIVRVLGEDGRAEMAPINQPVLMTPQGPVPAPEQVPPEMEGMTHVFDLTNGKYDLTVKVGPSFTSQREETASQMIELIRVFPQAAPVIGDILAQNMVALTRCMASSRTRASTPKARALATRSQRFLATSGTKTASTASMSISPAAAWFTSGIALSGANSPVRPTSSQRPFTNSASLILRRSIRTPRKAPRSSTSGWATSGKRSSRQAS